MSIKSKILVGLVAASLIVGSVMFGCSSDIVLPPLPTLLGEYEGKFVFITNYNQPSQITEEFDITWRFSDQSYWVSSLSTSLCSPSGAYLYADNVTLDELDEGCAGAISSNQKNPFGPFSVRLPNDSVVMTQISGDTLKEIRLIKVIEE